MPLLSRISEQRAQGTKDRPKNNFATNPSPLMGEGRVRAKKSGSYFSVEAVFG
jgi:hypothetical protein